MAVCTIYCSDVEKISRIVSNVCTSLVKTSSNIDGGVVVIHAKGLKPPLDIVWSHVIFRLDVLDSGGNVARLNLQNLMNYI